MVSFTLANSPGPAPAANGQPGAAGARGVIERRPVNRRAAKGEAIKAEEVSIPVTKDQVHVSKETVVTEEVGIKKRKVKGTQTVSANVSREELAVEEEGTATAQGNVPATKRSRKK